MLKYLKDHILEELDGSVDYMTEAVAHKGTKCGESFRIMSEAEAGHANTLLKMFNSTQRPEDISEAEYATLIKGIMDKYTDAMTKVENMKKVYWS